MEIKEKKSLENVYMKQAMAEQQEVARELKQRRNLPSPVVLDQLSQGAIAEVQNKDGLGEERIAPERNAITGVRITGWWRWKTVIVPPNMYVVHTRRGCPKPLHIGLGISFKFNPAKDSFLVVPSAMQTIVINANCICKELQGILVQAYVQWIIRDFEIAFQRLDFSDLEDPMRVVNVQLREQAEAAIKDKVATMSIHEVLSDKQPIIEELTQRLGRVAEGSGDDKGLGLKIVTVQIKEAIVSSARLWENLQQPFRAEKARIARLAELENSSIIKSHELEEKEKSTKAEMETDSVIAKIKHEKDAEAFRLAQEEAMRRHKIEQEAEQKMILEERETEKMKQDSDFLVQEKSLDNTHRLSLLRQEKEFEEFKKKITLAIESSKEEEAQVVAGYKLQMVKLANESEQAKKQLESDLERESLSLEAELDRESKRRQALNSQSEKDIAFEQARRTISNMLSPEYVQLKAVEMLPTLAKQLPAPTELHTITINGDGVGANLTGLVAAMSSLLEKYGIHLKGKKEEIKGA